MDIFEATKKGDEKTVKMLLEGGVNPNIQNYNGWTVLMIVSVNGQEKIVKILLDGGANPNLQNDGRTALMLASSYGHEKIVKMLLDGGANPNLQNNDGETALMIACENDHEKVVKMLLEGGADPNSMQNNGETALMIASDKGYEKVVKILLEGGADPNITLLGLTALLFASQNGHEKVVKALLDGGADPNTKNNSGWTVLMSVSADGQEKIVKMLLDGGADRNIQDNDGRTALMIAIENRHEKVVELLDTRTVIEKKVDSLLVLSGGRSNIEQTVWDKKRAISSSVGCFRGEEGTLCDINDQDDYKNQEYLDEDPGNLIFMIPSGDGFKAYGTNIRGIVYDKNTDLFLECVESENGVFRADGKKYALDILDLYVILKFEYQVYVSLNDLIGSLWSGERVFLVRPGNNKLKHTISYGIAYGFLNRVPYNLVSADHCQDGTEKVISELFVCVGDNC